MTQQVGMSGGPGAPGPGSGPPVGGVVVQGVRRAFGQVLAVEDMTLHARPGEITALIGPNGSGKTTLMLMLATLLVPDGGSVRVDGYDPVTQPREVRARLGWMPDGFGTWDALKVREVLEIIASAYGLRGTAAQQRIADLLRLVHLDDLADRPARVLSRGQKQRLGLARALVNDPSVLVLDEPANGLDPRSRIELRDIMRDLAAQGRTILVSSHILTELQEIADRAVIVARGRTIEGQTLSPTTTSTAYRLASPDPAALMSALPELGVRSTRAGTGVEVHVAGEGAATDLLRRLVRADVPLTAFAPAQGALEAAYLAVTEDRR
ncbi:ABC transporter ATP-binding protein [Janibacter melonis]|uniref:ABC transporter ATP-binding protein n=1 Tax=Janibacter melonis TaxID=262209 RepID=UPI001F20CE62|nr:ABC transporter ATP-binding protein [Janibacter melonis]